MTTSGRKIKNSQCHFSGFLHFRIKWVLKHILMILKNIFEKILVIFFVFMTFRYSQRQKVFLAKHFFQPLIYSNSTKAQRKIFFQKMTKNPRYGKKRAMPTLYIKQNDMKFLSLYIYIPTLIILPLKWQFWGIFLMN